MFTFSNKKTQLSFQRYFCLTIQTGRNRRSDSFIFLQLLSGTNLVERVSSCLLADIKAANQKYFYPLSFFLTYFIYPPPSLPFYYFSQSLSPYNGILIEFQTHLNTISAGFDDLKQLFDNSASWKQLHSIDNSTNIDLESGEVSKETESTPEAPREALSGSIGIIEDDEEDKDQDVVVTDAPAEEAASEAAPEVAPEATPEAAPEATPETAPETQAESKEVEVEVETSDTPAGEEKVAEEQAAAPEAMEVEPEKPEEDKVDTPMEESTA